MLFAGLLLAASVVALITYSIVFLLTGRISRDGSVEVGGGAVNVSNTPKSLRIVYRVEEFAGGDHQISTEVSRVRRPFDGVTEKRSGVPPGKSLQSSQTSAFGKVTFPASGTNRIILVTAPAIGIGDVRPDAVIEEALENRLIQRREVRRVAGRRCQVYRAGGPIAAGSLERVGSVAGEHADFCVDESGLLLEEAWFGTQTSLRVLKRPKLIRRKVAVTVEEEPTLSDDLFQIGEQNIPFETAGGRLRPLKPESLSPGKFWVLDPAKLTGFERFGKYLVVPPSMDVMGVQGPVGGPGQGNRIVSVSDVYIKDGRDLLVIDQGTTEQGRSPFGPPLKSGGVVLGDELGRGRVIRDMRMNEIRVSLEGGTFIRIYGTFPTDTLIDMLKSARPVEGSELEFAD